MSAHYFDRMPTTHSATRLRAGLYFCFRFSPRGCRSKNLCGRKLGYQQSPSVAFTLVQRMARRLEKRRLEAMTECLPTCILRMDEDTSSYSRRQVRAAS